jgi:glycosyltransferase involved in cell wall biosynthesis
MSDPTPLFSVVLPAHNEEGNVVPMVQQLVTLLQPLGDFEIIFVDDRSTDQTLPKLRALAAADRRVRYISFVRNFGHQIALRAGLRHARGRAIILMDCDFEHPPELIPTLIAHWQDGAKVVTTRRARDVRRASVLKRVMSVLFYRLFAAISDVKVEPGSADFLLLDRTAADAVNVFENRDIFLRGLVRWLGFPTATVNYTQGQRTSGEPSFTFKRMMDLAVTGIVTHSIRPLRIAIYLALIFAGFATLLLVYTVVSFLWISRTVAGWTSIMVAIATLGAGQFLVLGILGEYFGRMFLESRRWPLYLISETEASGPSADIDRPRGPVQRISNPRA